MRIAYLTLESTVSGHAAFTHVHEIIRGLRGADCDVTLFEPRTTSARRSVGSKLVGYAATQMRLWRALRQFDVVYSRMHPACLPTALLARLLAVPVVQEINGPPTELPLHVPLLRRFPRIVRFFTETPIRRAHAVVAVTPQLAAWARSCTTRQVVVIPNAADVEHFRPHAALQIELPRPYAVFFGTLAPWQGIKTILDAINSPGWPAEVHLVFAGTGALQPEVEAVAAMDSRVHYIGAQPYATIPGIVANSLAGLIPKNNVAGHAESGLSPLKLYETLACGVPAIVSDIPGQADTIRLAGCGLVIPPNDANALADAVRQIAHDDDLRSRMGAAARSAVDPDHSWAQRARVTLSLLRSVAKPHSHRPTRQSLAGGRSGRS